ncbi:hypothetical protein P9112_014177 [Eukaryota sp. TZLM1-RC]
MFAGQFNVSDIATQDEHIRATQTTSAGSQQFDFFDFGSQSQSQNQPDFTDPKDEPAFFNDNDSSSQPRQTGKAPRARGTFISLEDPSPDQAPPSAEDSCAYCSLSEGACLVQCDCCRKWFCNARLGSSGSHIVNHLVRSKHKEINLHPDSPLGDTILECYSCGCRNIFLLGFVPAKGEHVVVLLCREPCLSRTKNPDWSLDKWLPLITDKALLPWVLRPPTMNELENPNVKLISSSQANSLEHLWLTRPYASLDDLIRISNGQEDPLVSEVPKVALNYEDGKAYDTVFTPLVQLEAENDRKVKESQSTSGITIRWDTSQSRRRQACFQFPSFSADSELRLVVGDELRLRYSGDGRHPPWSCVGHVLRFNTAEEVVVELKPGSDSNRAPVDVSIGFSVDFIWKSTSFDRMLKALSKLSRDQKSVSKNIKQMLLGHPAQCEPAVAKGNLPQVMSAPHLPELNPSQQQAVKTVLTSAQPISMIQGPPGTGKSVTSATIVYYLTQELARNAKKNTMIMVCAPSNTAADRLAQLIHETGVRAVRVFAKSRESIASPVEHLALHNVILQVESERKAQNGKSNLAKLTQQKLEQGELSTQDEHRYIQLKVAAEREVLKNCQVIVTTCVGAGDTRLKHLKYKYVLIDEATASTEPECLIPLVSGATKVILVGDHCQLGPVVLCKEAANAGLSQSMFERLVLLGHRPTRLQIQYRMHPMLAEFPSDTFYEGTLQNGVTACERVQSRDHGAFPWVDPTLPLLFHVCTGAEELSASGTSYLNRTEASFVEKCVTEFLKTGVSPDQIGVITPYEGQRSFIVSHMQRCGPLHSNLYRDVEVASVDSFQGREKDYIILSCVRSNDLSSIGFLSDSRRLNVALTRAKYGLVITGNPKVLSRHVLWNKLILWYKNLACFVEGPLTALRRSKISIPKPRMPVMRPTQRRSSVAEGTKNDKSGDKAKWNFSFNVPSSAAIPELPNFSFDAGGGLFDDGTFYTQSFD